MAGELIGALRVALGWDTAEFTAGAKKAKAEARSTAETIQSSVDGLRGAVTAAFTGALATAAIGAAKRALDYASSLGEVSQQLGVTTRDLQIYRYAASQVGVDQEDMDKSLAKLTLTIGKAADGSKAQATNFRDLGVSVRTASGEVRTAGEVMPDLAEALSRVKDPATRARIEVELFGKTGQKLDTLLAGGRKGINELEDAAAQLGLVLSDKLISQADEAADKVSALQQVLEAKLAGAVAENADAIISYADAALRLVTTLPAAIDWLERFRLKLAIAQDSGALANPLSYLTGRDAIKQRLERARGRLDQMNSAGVTGSLAQRFPIQPIFTPSPSRAPSEPSSPSTAGGGGGRARIGRPGRSQAQGGADDFARLRAELLPLSAALADVARQQGRWDTALQQGKISADDHAIGLEALRKKTHDLIVTEDSLPLSIANVAPSFEGLGDAGERAADAIGYAIGRTTDALAAAQDRTDELASTLNDDIAQGLFSVARGFGSLKDVALKVIDDIAQATLSRLMPSGGAGGIGGAIAGLIFGGLGSKVPGVSSAISGAGALSVATPSISLPPLPKLAQGGIIGGLGGVDQNLLSINGMPVAKVGRGEMLRVEPDNDNGGRGMVVHQTIQFTGAVDIADRGYVNRIGMAAKQGAIDAMRDQGRRRG